MALIEVEAVVAFRDWKQGERRQVDGDDFMIQQLVYAGYLRTTAVFEAIAAQEPQPQPRPKLRRKRSKADNDGPDHPVPAASNQNSTAPGDPAGPDGSP